MLTTHVHLILTGRSTVESFKGRDQMEQEDRILQLEYGYLWHNKEKRKVKRRWKEEWGGTSVDERWKWGTPGELWKEEMGAGWAGWICEFLAASRTNESSCWQAARRWSALPVQSPFRNERRMVTEEGLATKFTY